MSRAKNRLSKLTNLYLHWSDELGPAIGGRSGGVEGRSNGAVKRFNDCINSKSIHHVRPINMCYM